VNPIVAPAFQGLGALIPQEGTRLDVAHYPNPFISQTVGAGGFIDNQESVLELVDGGEDGQNIPLQPLLVKDRQVDVILAIDAVRLFSCN
jgi:lysophospholipase